jgi:translocation and assembly module TamB
MDGKTPRKSFKRRLVRSFLALVMVSVLALAALPWLLSTTAARQVIVAVVNRALAPSKVGVRGLSLAWSGPLRLSGLSLEDAQGKTLIAAKHAVLDRGLGALLLDHTRLGMITLVDADVDIERHSDGSIDLIDALVPRKDDPRDRPPVGAKAEVSADQYSIEVNLRIIRGSLRIKSPELVEPFKAQRMDMEVRVPSDASRKLSWRVRLAKPEGGTDAERLGIDGELDLHTSIAPYLAVTVKGERWPLAAMAEGLAVRGRLDGLLKLTRREGRWVSSGDANLLDVDVSGQCLAGDRLDLSAVGFAWDMKQSDAGWSLSKLEVTSPVASLSASGSANNGGRDTSPQITIDGRLDLAALAGQLPHAFRLRDGLTVEQGSLKVAAALSSDGTAQTGSIEAGVSDIRLHSSKGSFTLKRPGTLKGIVRREGRALRVETLAVDTAFVRLKGSGDIEKGVRFTGTIDLGAIESEFSDLIDLGGVALAGKGPMVGEYKRTDTGYLARYAAQVSGLRIAGLGADPLVRDAVRFDAAANGPVDETGMPRTWENLRVNLTSNEDAVAIAGQLRAGITALSAMAKTPVKLSDREALAEARIAARHRPGQDQGPGVVEIDELRLGVRPKDPALAAQALAFAARGRIDLRGDRLTLSPLPIPAAAVAPVMLAPEGLSIQGLWNTPLTGRTIKGSLIGDLAALDEILTLWGIPSANGLGGSYTTRIMVAPGDAGRLNLGLAVLIADLSHLRSDGKGRRSEGPVNLGFRGTYEPSADRLDCDSVSFASRYGGVDLRGTLDEPAGRRIADLKGTLAPNWQAVSALAAELVEPKMRVQGRDRPFHVKGPLFGDSLIAILKGLDAEFGIELASADAFGLALGPAPIVVRSGGGSVTIDPIETTLNNGKVMLKPALDLDVARGIALRLQRGSKIDGAEINDEVSKRVLSYIAPVLNEATHVNGMVEIAVEQAEFPLTGSADRTMSLTGQVLFRDVVFEPGPFANQLLALAGKPDAPGIRIEQPVQLAIANRRVIQKGLEIPFRRNVKIALEGSVGFDETLDLKASVPIARGTLANSAGLDDAVGGKTMVVPIDGTVSKPRINKQALQIAVRELSRSILKKDLSKEASKLLDRLGASPTGPNRAGDPTPTDSRGLERELLRRVLPGRRGDGQ